MPRFDTAQLGCRQAWWRLLLHGRYCRIAREEPGLAIVSLGLLRLRYVPHFARGFVTRDATQEGRNPTFKIYSESNVEKTRVIYPHAYIRALTKNGKRRKIQRDAITYISFYQQIKSNFRWVAQNNYPVLISYPICKREKLTTYHKQLRSIGAHDKNITMMWSEW